MFSQIRHNPRRLAILAGATLLALAVYALVVLSLFAPDRDDPALSSGGVWLEPPKPVADFTLTDQDGNPRGLADLQGRPTLLFFGYTLCPDICPTTLAEFTRVKRKLGADADAVNVVFISVDGSRDTPQRLKPYLAALDPSFIGLTGDEEQVRQIGTDFGIFFQRREEPGTSAGYLVDHTASSFLLDATGQQRVVFPYGTSTDSIAADVQTVLNEGR